MKDILCLEVSGAIEHQIWNESPSFIIHSVYLGPSEPHFSHVQNEDNKIAPLATS